MYLTRISPHCISEWDYFIVIIRKPNRNSPTKDPITKMGVAHAFEPCNYETKFKLFFIE